MTADERSDLLDRWYVQRLDELIEQTPVHERAGVKTRAGNPRDPLGLRLRDQAAEDVERVSRARSAIVGRQGSMF